MEVGILLLLACVRQIVRMSMSQTLRANSWGDRALANKLPVSRLRRCLQVWTLPSVSLCRPVGVGRPFCGGPLSACPDGKGEDSWRRSLWWTLQPRSVWTARIHTGPASLEREPWPHMSWRTSGRLEAAVCSEDWRWSEGKHTKFNMQMFWGKGKMPRLTLSSPGGAQLSGLKLQDSGLNEIPVRLCHYLRSLKCFLCHHSTRWLFSLSTW